MKLLLVIAGMTLIGLLSFTFPSVRNLSYRKGAGWYLDARERPYPEASPGSGGPVPPYQMSERRPVVSTFVARIWLVAGLASLGLAALLWSEFPVIAIVVAILGLLLIGMTAEAGRQHRDAAKEPTGPAWSPKHPRRRT